MPTNVIEFKRNGAPSVPVRQPPPTRWWRRRWFKVVLWLTVVCSFAAMVTAEYILRNAEPILRRRIIETLSGEFNSPVELDELHLSLKSDVEVRGRGLRILHNNGALQAGEHRSTPQPMLAVQAFSFHTTLRKLLHSPTRIGVVTLHGVELHIPPTGENSKALGAALGEQAADLEETYTRPKVTLIVDQFLCSDAKLFFSSAKLGEDLSAVELRDLHLQNLGAHRPFTYGAELTRRAPRGDMSASGHFGPWNTEEPAATPLDAEYPSIGGVPDTSRHFSGTLNQFAFDGNRSDPKAPAHTAGSAPQLTSAQGSLLPSADHAHKQNPASPQRAVLGSARHDDVPTGTVSSDLKTGNQPNTPAGPKIAKAQPESEKAKKQREKADRAASDFREKAQRKAQKEEEKAERRAAAAAASRHPQ